MSEKNIVKKTKRFRENRRLTESEAFIYPVGIKAGISRISLALPKSLPSLMTARPNATKSEI